MHRESCMLSCLRIFGQYIDMFYNKFDRSDKFGL
jgi:hypothetical protein